MHVKMTGLKKFITTVAYLNDPFCQKKKKKNQKKKNTKQMTLFFLRKKKGLVHVLSNPCKFVHFLCGEEQEMDKK
jgi:hypothetical protein